MWNAPSENAAAAQEHYLRLFGGKLRKHFRQLRMARRRAPSICLQNAFLHPVWILCRAILKLTGAMVAHGLQSTALDGYAGSARSDAL